jgi:hypothetical protein
MLRVAQLARLSITDVPALGLRLGPRERGKQQAESDQEKPEFLVPTAMHAYGCSVRMQG